MLDEFIGFSELQKIGLSEHATSDFLAPKERLKHPKKHLFFDANR
jgi:hypothetical protein